LAVGKKQLANIHIEGFAKTWITLFSEVIIKKNILNRIGHK
jgi:hypothetical protein